MRRQGLIILLQVQPPAQNQHSLLPANTYFTPPPPPLIHTQPCLPTDPLTCPRAPQSPPRGLQLHLGTSDNPHQVDTLVMSNLGYFQLKAAPGWYYSSVKL